MADSETTEKLTIWNKAFIMTMAFELLTQFGNNFINPIVSNAAVAMGATVAVAGLMVSVNPVTACLLRPVGGLIMQMASKKRLLIAASILYAIATFSCAVVANVAALGVCRVLMGVAFVMKSVLVVSIASSVIPRECVGQGVSTIGMCTVLASAFGPAIGSWIGLNMGYRYTFLVAGCLFAGALILSFFLPDTEKNKESANDVATNSAANLAAAQEEVPEKRSLGQEIRSRFSAEKLFHFKTFPLAGLTLFEAFYYGSITGLVLLIGEQRGIDGSALFFFCYAITALIFRPLSGKLFDKYGLSKIFYPEAILMSLCSVVLVFASNMFLFGLAGVMLALGQGCLYPCLQAESVRGTDPEETAIAVNTFYIGADGGMALGPAVGGALLDFFGSGVMCWIDFGLVMVLIALFPVYWKWRQTW